MTDKRLTVGSWSEGSTRDEDIAQAILDMASSVGITYDEGIVISGETDFDYVARWLAHYNDHEDEPCDGETSGDHFRACPLSDGLYLDGAINALDEYAPYYCYVGMVEGDGANFGVWPDHDSIERAIREGERVDDETVINREDGVRIHTNDHGNIEVYSLDSGESILALV
jgi:hypothetical protein